MPKEVRRQEDGTLLLLSEDGVTHGPFDEVGSVDVYKGPIHTRLCMCVTGWGLGDLMEVREILAYVSYYSHPVARVSCLVSQILFAIGRKPLTRDLGLEAAQVAVDERGFIVADELQQTSTKGVYAVGDVTGKVGDGIK